MDKAAKQNSAVRTGAVFACSDVGRVIEPVLKTDRVDRSERQFLGSKPPLARSPPCGGFYFVGVLLLCLFDSDDRSRQAYSL